MKKFTHLEYYELSEVVRNFLPENAPFASRFRAAKALLPLISQDLIISLYFLCFDEDSRISEQAKESLKDLPDDITIPVLNDPKTSPKILKYFGLSMPEKDSVIQAVALNSATEDDVFAQMGRACRNERLLEIFSINQNRLLRYPKLISELRKNPLTPRSTLERMENFYRLQTGKEYVEESEIEKPAVPIEQESSIDEDSSGILSQDDLDTALPTVDEYVDDAEDTLSDDLPPNFTIDDILKQDFQTDDFFAEEFLVDPELELSSEKRESLENKIRKMRVLDKMQLGLRGNIEARNILMKSPNKMIQECVLNNPKISIDEIIRYSRNKSFREELIRIIASKKEWTKNYQVRLGLVWNPKTPMTMALKWLSSINPKDLEKLGRSKQIPGMLAVSARKALIHKKRFQ